MFTTFFPILCSPYLGPSGPVARDSDSDSNRQQTLSSDSAAPSQHQTSHEESIPVPESGRLPSSSGESQPMVYAQLNVKQTQVPSPASVEPVQYALIEHQDKP